MSLPAKHEPCLSIAIETSTGKVSPLEAESERQIECQGSTNADLRRRLEEASFQIKMLEFDLDHHKEVIKEVLGELRQRDHTIQAQSGLLRACWLEGQALAASQRQTRQALPVQLENLSADSIAMVHNGRKRKFSEYLRCADVL
jgi:hypothetical protein